MQKGGESFVLILVSSFSHSGLVTTSHDFLVRPPGKTLFFPGIHYGLGIGYGIAYMPCFIFPTPCILRMTYPAIRPRVDV